MNRIIAQSTTLALSLILLSSAEAQTITDINGNIISAPVNQQVIVNYNSVSQACCQYEIPASSPIFMNPSVSAPVTVVQPYGYTVTETEEMSWLIFCDGDWVVKFCPLGQIAICNNGVAECQPLFSTHNR